MIKITLLLFSLVVFSQGIEYEGKLKLHDHYFPETYGKIFVALDGDVYDLKRNEFPFQIKSGHLNDN